MKQQSHLYLASQSPRRRALLEQIGVHFKVLSVDVPEIRQADESPEDYVCRLAADKARAGSAGVSDVPVLGADTLGVHRGHVLEKPRDKADALAMLARLSGDKHQVYSAVSLSCGDHQKTILVVTDVQFRKLTASEIENYWATGEPRDKAGSYAIQGFGAIFVESLSGSYSGVVGLPLTETCALLAEFGVPWWQKQ